MPLDPQVARWRERRIADQVRPLYTQTLAEARAADLAEIQAGAGAPEPVAEVMDLSMPVAGASLPLRLYRPSTTAPLPALVYFFGGGWTLGQIETCDGICRTLANAAGCAVIAVGYRLAPEHKFPVAVGDCYDALGWIAGHAGELGVDPGRLAVGGDSAGGNLAAAVTLLARQRGGPALAAQLLVYPNTCYGADTRSMRESADDPSMFNRRSVDWYWGHYLASPADGADPLASPLLAPDHSGLPPALVITAEYDPLRDEGEQYAEKLRAAGVPTECTRYDGMMHGFFLMSSTLDGGRRAVEQAVAFLRARLGTGQVAAPVVSLEDYEARARALLPPQVWDFAAGGSGAETTLRANRRALEAVVVYPRVLAGSLTETGTSLLGTPMSTPVAVAPMAYQRLMHPAGEVAMAEAAHGAGVPMMLSALSSCPVEEVAATGVAFWFQLYWLAERHRLEQLIERAEDAGSRALVVTLDVPVLGRRLRDVRNEFALPADVVAANLSDGAGSRAHVAHAGESALAAHTTSTLFGPALGWADLEWLRGRTSLPLALKGILDPRDARRAVDLGADAIVVSNHGGRQLDAAPASVTALPAVVAEVGQQCQVLLDSGIRSGTDVLRALALGADGVLIGRPLLWALAVDGAAGAARALAMLSTEIHESLILAGCPGLAAVRELRTAWDGGR
jgi:isopentenyl diphosphate isomerase/L-lactate dehydrogenase-like FMN-dependent dehydrogenase/acetyl esterase/lipase